MLERSRKTIIVGGSFFGLVPVEDEIKWNYDDSAVFGGSLEREEILLEMQ